MDWDTLETISEFDRVSDSEKTDSNNGDHKKQGSTNIPYKRSNTSLEPSTSTSLLIESLIQLLCKLIEEEPALSEESYNRVCKQLHARNLIDDSYNVKELEGTRNLYQKQIYKILCAVRGQNMQLTLPLNCRKREETVDANWSRYRSEFDEIDFIAKGGFGKVYCARNKLDGVDYAIKQIEIHSRTIKLCHVMEVKTIASLNHPNIVQYKAAWLEPYISNNKHKNLNRNLSTKDDSSTTNESCSPLSNFNDNNTTGTDLSDFIQFKRSNNHELNEHYSENSQLLCKYENNSVNCDYHLPKLAILYIQMTLCQINLRKWLDERNCCSNFNEYYSIFLNKSKSLVNHRKIINDIFYQSLTGLNYIHSKNIVHHDIKPSNIFLATDNTGKLVVQLGDFGMACPLETNNHDSMAIGTPLYAAPEQIEGQCNPKSDIYSLGIVLIELLLKFATDMERIEIILNARKLIFTDEIDKKTETFLKILLSNCSDRPTTIDILNALHINHVFDRNMRVLQISDFDFNPKNI